MSVWYSDSDFLALFKTWDSHPLKHCLIPVLHQLWESYCQTSRCAMEWQLGTGAQGCFWIGTSLLLRRGKKWESADCYQWIWGLCPLSLSLWWLSTTIWATQIHWHCSTFSTEFCWRMVLYFYQKSNIKSTLLHVLKLFIMWTCWDQ